MFAPVVVSCGGITKSKVSGPTVKVDELLVDKGYKVTDALPAAKGVPPTPVVVLVSPVFISMPDKGAVTDPSDDLLSSIILSEV